MIDFQAIREQLSLLGHNLPDDQIVSILKEMNIPFTQSANLKAVEEEDEVVTDRHELQECSYFNENTDQSCPVADFYRKDILEVSFDHGISGLTGNQRLFGSSDVKAALDGDSLVSYEDQDLDNPCDLSVLSLNPSRQQADRLVSELDDLTDRSSNGGTPSRGDALPVRDNYCSPKSGKNSVPRSAPAKYRWQEHLRDEYHHDNGSVKSYNSYATHKVDKNTDRPKKVDRVSRYRELQEQWKKDKFLKSGGGAAPRKLAGPSFHSQFAVLHAQEAKALQVAVKANRAKSAASAKATNDYIPPTSKRRDDVRWDIRVKMLGQDK